MSADAPMSRVQLLAGLRISLSRHEDADPQKFSDRMAAQSLRAIIADLEAVEPEPHPAHTGHRFGGGYARASAMLAGDPDWMNATGGAADSDCICAAYPHTLECATVPEDRHI